MNLKINKMGFRLFFKIDIDNKRFNVFDDKVKILKMSKKDIPRIELGLLDSKSNVLTITPYVLAKNSLIIILIYRILSNIIIQITQPSIYSFCYQDKK